MNFILKISPHLQYRYINSNPFCIWEVKFYENDFNDPIYGYFIKMISCANGYFLTFERFWDSSDGKSFSTFDNALMALEEDFKNNVLDMPDNKWKWYIRK